MKIQTYNVYKKREIKEGDKGEWKYVGIFERKYVGTGNNNEVTHTSLENLANDLALTTIRFSRNPHAPAQFISSQSRTIIKEEQSAPLNDDELVELKVYFDESYRKYSGLGNNLK